MAILHKLIKKLTYKQLILFTALLFCFIGSVLFVFHNHSFYERPIVEVTETSIIDTTETVDNHNNEDILYTQIIIAEIKNGKEQGQSIKLMNEYSTSQAYTQEYQVGNELFIKFDENESSNSSLVGTIQEVKRDKYILLVAWLFVLILLIVGKRQGLFSIISLAINVLLISYALDVYIHTSGTSLLWICGISVVLFTIISLLLVNGRNEKTYAAIVATLLGSFLSLLITFLVMKLTSENGLRYEEMGFLTRPPHVVFMAGLFIGSLGAVMDVAITMSSSIFTLFEKNNHIATDALKKSGMEIGKDIMGTMTNILFFAYVSGSIPSLILYLKNGSPLSYTFSINLSLELTRALAGGIGIVITIPIGLYCALFFVNRKKANL
ncbi:YibE/F family protein [Aquibacillus koreensis]|uniref:YibE/F family protein n=1 Tax=Aquibacillus koreensis TaxID=279446 RepID=A0A9X4AL29_9BACI|nr:YibE/F family protein [Aquibacillus koreensis]MCT2536880.1 YibE/F family protein [Aquibacillus koreensis]MDC3421988.1 YibE/F family protein [Aquibacillus koreensis]